MTTVANNPPQKPTYKYLTDEQGNPVLNRYGHPISQPLTSEDKKQLEELLASGVSQKEAAKRLNTTLPRVQDYLKRANVADRIAVLTMARTLAVKAEDQAAQLTRMVEIIQQLETRVSHMQTEIKAIHKATQRQRIGRAVVERDRRSQRAEVTRLRNELWKRTGKRPVK